MLAGAALAALVLSACGGGSEDATATGSDSPLADLLGFGDYDPVEARRQDLEREEAVSTCMREEGFEYTPVDYEAQFGGTDVDDVTEAFTDPESYGKKYGYGIVRNYEQYELPYVGENGEDGDGSFGGGPQFEDPNEDYVQSLSPAEQETFYETLYGSFDEPAEEFGDEATEEYAAPPLEEQGCYGRAEQEVGRGDDALSNPDVEQALTDAYEGIEDDSRLVTAEADWKECMVEALDGIDMPDGFVLNGVDSMYQLFEQKKGEAAGQRVVPYEESDDGTGEIDGEQIYGSTIDADGNGYAVIGEPQPIGPDALERLRAEELEVWALDWECQGSAKMQEARQQIEQELVDTLLQQFPDLGNDDS